jgi:hypothetical protein
MYLFPGGKVAFVWDVLHRVCTHLGVPLVVLVRDIEKTVCSSYDSYDSFVLAFGSLSKKANRPYRKQKGHRQNLVLLGGTGLSEKPEPQPSTLR